MLKVKGLRDDVPEEFLSHKEKYENAIRKAVTYYRVIQEAADPNQNDEERAMYVYPFVVIKHYGR